MVDQRACVYCVKFNRQIAKTYPDTVAGEIAPLRRVSRLKKWPSDLAGIVPAYATPTFILVDEGREVGRFAGYSEPETFWMRLQPLLAALDSPTSALPDEDEEVPFVPRLPRPRPKPPTEEAVVFAPGPNPASNEASRREHPPAFR